MKILIANKFYRPVGGPETIMLDTERELKAMGHTPIPFSMAHPENLDSEYSDYFVSCIDYNNQARGPARLVKEAADMVYSKEARRNIERLIADTRPDIAHSHNIYHQMSPSILSALRKAGIPSLLTFHDYKPLCANMLFMTGGQICERCAGRWFHHAVIHKCVKDSYAGSLVCCIEETLHRLFGSYERNVDLFITPSRFLKRKLVEHRRLREDRIEVLYNYADTKCITPEYQPGDYGLFVGRMDSHKGVLTVLKAAREIPDFEIRFAGRGPILEECRRVAEREGLKNVKFLGFQTGADLTRQLRESRFVLVPSEWYENCPMVVLEGLAAGKPVIASKIGGIPELVDHGTDGLLFEPGSAEQLSSAMKQLIGDPSLVEEMGRRGRAKVEERFSIEVYMDSLLSIYRRFTERG